MTNHSFKPFRVLAPLLALVLLASACGSNESSEDDGTATKSAQVASLSDSVTTTTDKDGIEAPDDPEEAFRLFEQCMQDEGIDMNVSGGADGGGLIIGGRVDASEPAPQSGLVPLGEDFDIEALNEAQQLCSQHLENIDNSFDLSPEQEVALEETQREFQACMAEQGIDLPDFSSGGGISIGAPVDESDPQDDVQSFDAVDFDFEAFEQAAEVCNEIFEDIDDIFRS